MPHATTQRRNSATVLAETLKGQSFDLCDLNALFDSKTWPRETNPHINEIRDAVDEFLNRTAAGHKSFKTLKKSDFGLFGATWWPRAEPERAKICTFLAIWLFLWDDEIDSSSGALWDDFENSQIYRQETQDFVRFCLNLPCKTDWTTQKPSSQIIADFDIIGFAIAEAYNEEQREKFASEMQIFMDMSEKEQRIRLSGEQPSIETFWRYRLGSSAVAVCLALNEYAYTSVDVPPHIRDSPASKRLWDYTNIIISTVNDMLSIKKEVARGSIESLLPIMYLKNPNLQECADDVTEFLVKSMEGFQETAQEVLQENEYSPDSDRQQAVRMIEACTFLCTGNLTWSLATGRYQIHQEDLSEGLRIQL